MLWSTCIKWLTSRVNYSNSEIYMYVTGSREYMYMMCCLLTCVSWCHWLSKILSCDWKSVCLPSLKIILQTMSFIHCLYCGCLRKALNGGSVHCHTTMTSCQIYCLQTQISGYLYTLFPNRDWVVHVHVLMHVHLLPHQHCQYVHM